MAITRRDFLKYTAVTGAALYLGIFDLKPIKAYAQSNPPVWLNEAKSVGVYCSGGCGMIVGSNTLPGYGMQEYITYVQGNPDSVINAGRICSKCASSAQISTIIDPATGNRIPNPKRVTQPMKRVGGTNVWTNISWTAAISEIAQKVVATRSATFTLTANVPSGKHKGPVASPSLVDFHGRDFVKSGVTVGMTLNNTTDGSSTVITAINTTNALNDTLVGILAGGAANNWNIDDKFEVVHPITVNRCTGIATLGGSSLNNEAAYLISKLNRALGVVYLETQARN